MKLVPIFEKIILQEYSENFINDLIKKFKNEQYPEKLPNQIIRWYIDEFKKISKKLENRDITTYKWYELERVVDANRLIKINTGDKNTGKPSSSADLIYNKNDLRIYLAKTKKSCIQYGTGYNFCISSRGEQNMYDYYRFEKSGTPYFIFDDQKSSERNEKGEFIDKNHLLVVFVYSEDYFSVTDANNEFENEYESFNEIIKDYPRLNGLQNLFVSKEPHPKEKKIYDIKIKWNNSLDSIDRLGLNKKEQARKPRYRFPNIEVADEKIDQIMSGKIKIVLISATGKNEECGYDDSAKYLIDDKNTMDDAMKDFVERLEGDLECFKIETKKIDINDETMVSYLAVAKIYVEQYRNEISKFLANENV